MGKPFRHIPNAVTLLRPGLACVFIALLPGRFGGGSGIAAVAVFCAICLTDFLDGRLARALGAATEAGAYLDLISDFFYIAASLVTLNILGQMPVWFTAAMLIKFIEYIVTSRILCRGGDVFIPDPFGRIAAGLFFIVPGLACAFFDTPPYPVILPAAMYLAGSLTLVSSVTRWVSCAGIMGKRGAVQRGVSR
jgi:phosphatidylglycerophosphate synthase